MFLVLNSWSGRMSYPVEVMGETKTRVRIKLLADCRLPGNRQRLAGDIALVPKDALSTEPAGHIVQPVA